MKLTNSNTDKFVDGGRMKVRAIRKVKNLAKSKRLLFPVMAKGRLGTHPATLQCDAKGGMGTLSSPFCFIVTEGYSLTCHTKGTVYKWAVKVVEAIKECGLCNKYRIQIMESKIS